MISQYLINKYTFKDGSVLELEDRVCPVNELEIGCTYLSCIINLEQVNGTISSGANCFVRCDLSHPDSWLRYRDLVNEMMVDVFEGPVLCALVKIVKVIPGESVAFTHHDGAVDILPLKPVPHAALSRMVH